MPTVMLFLCLERANAMRVMLLLVVTSPAHNFNALKQHNELEELVIATS
jgi:hypothetical protein